VYESYFGLHEPAFSLTPDPRFIWLSETHEEGLAAICYGITRRKGFILLTGEVGSGKSTILRTALERVPTDLLDVPETAMVMNTAGLDAVDLLKLIAAEFRIGGPQFPWRGALRTAADYILALNQFLLDRLRSGLNTVLIIDEAQNLSLGALEQVRLLSNLETDSHKLLQIVLTGQPELRTKLADPRLRQLRQRIAIEHHIEPLTPQEVNLYLRHRVKVAGGNFDHIFAPGAESLFARFSGGCPRLINLLADRSLLSAYAHHLNPVPPELIEKKAKEMDAVLATARTQPVNRTR
jgi:general secretion pathway protein A